MKHSIAFAATLVALVSTIEPTSANNIAISSDTKLPSPTEALDTVKNIDLPKGITLSGTVEPIQAPASIKDAGTDAKNKKESDITDNQIAIANDKQDHQDHQEWYGRGLGWGVGGWGGLGWGGWGRWGGWGGFGPYRFGYSCGGLGGWAYPLGYWNAFGAGLYGGGCGLGLAWGGLYYC
ncbi:hypothetical protein Poli38472_013968 [Pythium oligandrum]|uniref:Uncharacterized protein n=1 Tax=Pythium oligandrum TaxID=41045 RepID=A0A8K1CQ42_PYTOL|nr:hypothetical protein Poli38472_013968 [Pythium oligandrum]|eukprot:TMW66656.1 hypothetical protein Poli38472_013968 [Pythium oligandrum]